ncbi:MAG: diguanylate cyclase, partial [Salinisphaeraceae bacterium]|nr:diguanylate cyclase [Salinisphaeraceae bacterium]
EAMQAAGNAVLITDASGEIEWTNPAFNRLSGFSNEEVIGKNPRLLKSGKQRPRYYQRLWRSLMAGKIWTGETVDKDSHGELFTIRQTISPVMRNGKPEHFISIHEDISSQKAMQSARDRARRYDDITGLLTPTLFYDRLSVAVRACQQQQRQLALLILTLEIFDAPEGSLSSEIKLTLLQSLGEKIRTAMGPDDFAACIDEGEFAIVLQQTDNRNVAEEAGEQLLKIINRPMPEVGERLFLDPHIGIALCPEDDSDADALMHLADLRATRAGALALSG